MIPDKLLILAGSDIEADYWIKTKQKDKNIDYVYIFSDELLKNINNLTQLKGVKYIRIGTWYNHIKINMILEILKFTGVEEVKIKHNNDLDKEDIELCEKLLESRILQTHGYKG